MGAGGGKGIEGLRPGTESIGGRGPAEGCGRAGVRIGFAGVTVQVGRRGRPVESFCRLTFWLIVRTAGGRRGGGGGG